MVDCICDGCGFDFLLRKLFKFLRSGNKVKRSDAGLARHAVITMERGGRNVLILQPVTVSDVHRENKKKFVDAVHFCTLLNSMFSVVLKQLILYHI